MRCLRAAETSLVVKTRKKSGSRSGRIAGNKETFPFGFVARVTELKAFAAHCMWLLVLAVVVAADAAEVHRHVPVERALRLHLPHSPSLPRWKRFRLLGGKKVCRAK